VSQCKKTLLQEIPIRASTNRIIPAPTPNKPPKLQHGVKIDRNQVGLHRLVDMDIHVQKTDP
jgi:hypothetical protein